MYYYLAAASIRHSHHRSGPAPLSDDLNSWRVRGGNLQMKKCVNFAAVCHRRYSSQVAPAPLTSSIEILRFDRVIGVYV